MTDPSNLPQDLVQLLSGLTGSGMTIDELQEQLMSIRRNQVPDPTEPGWCWLHLVAQHGRARAATLGKDVVTERLQGHMSSFPGDYNAGHFSARLGTKGGLSRGQVKHIDIVPAQFEHSRLTAAQLLAALPHGWQIGGDSSEEVERVIPTVGPNSICIDVRDGPALTDGTAVVFQQMPFSSPRVSAAVAPWVHADAHSVIISFTPTAASRYWFLEVTYCWTRADEGQMRTQEEILSANISGILTLAPAGPDNFWSKLTIQDPIGKAAIAGTIKPCIPGSCQPVLSVHVKPTWIGEDDPPRGDIAFKLVSSTSLSIH